jgi:hypothetical protein
MIGRGVVGVVVMASALAWAGPNPLQFPETAQPLGLTKHKLSLAYDRLCAPPLSDPAFVLADVDFTLTRRFTEYSGDISGRLLGALGLAGDVLERATPMVDVLVSALPDKQRPGGHFGAPQDLDARITQERDMPILWGNGRLLRALAEQLRRHPNPAMREAALKLGDYVIATRPYYGKKENFEAVGGVFASGFTTCYPSLIDGLVQLGITTGEARFFDEARFIAELSLADTEFDGRHSHGRLTAYRGMLELDLAKGTRDFIGTVEEGVQAISSTYAFPTGGIPELFDTSYERDEGCSTADWIWVHLLLWQATGKPQYLDVADNVVRNHLYATQFANGGFGHYRFTNLADGDTAVRGAGIASAASDSYWCCSMHGTQLLADLPFWGAVLDGEHLRITWLAEVKATLRVKEVTVELTVEEPEPGRWKVHVAPERAVDAALALRVPGWAQALRIDGAEHSARDGWVVLERAWDAPTTLAIEFPTALRAHPASGLPGPVLVYSGANLLCLPDIALRPEFQHAEFVPSVTVCPDRVVDAHVPALVRNGDGRYQQVLLGPMAQRLPGGCRFVFAYSAVSADAFDPLWLKAAPPAELGTVVRAQVAVDARYHIYLNGAKLLEHSGWQESPTVEANTIEKSNLVAVAVPANAAAPGMIGLIRVGDTAIVTDSSAWRAYVFDGLPPSLTSGLLANREPVRLVEVGEWGAPPWRHVPGHFAASGARWIWVDPARLPEDGWVVFARTFTGGIEE